MKDNYVYILRCNDGTYYTGWTNNLEKRIIKHNSGNGAKYTKVKKRRPSYLVFYILFETKQEAMSQEYKIKQLSRKEKEDLIKTFDKRRISTLKKINDKVSNLISLKI